MLTATVALGPGSSRVAATMSEEGIRVPRPRRAVTQTDVAREAGVSRGLVSLALAGSPLVADATREHIEQTARRLGYRVNRTASSLASGRTGLIGLVLPDLRNPFFDFIADALRAAAREAGFRLLIVVGRAAEDAAEAIDTLVSMRVEGVVLVSSAMSDERIRVLAETIPVCVIGRQSAGGLVDTVRLDERAAARAVVAHLAEAGAQALLYLAPRPEDDPNAEERGCALAHAAEASGLPFEILTRNSLGAVPLEDEIARAVAALGRVGVVAHNDVVALDASAAIAASGVWVPLVSYDDTYLARFPEFSLTSVEQPAERMSRDAIRFLSERTGRMPLTAASAAAGTVGTPGGDEEGEGPSMPGRDLIVPPVLAVRASSRALS